MRRTLALVLVLALPASADEIELLDGTVIEGKVTDLGDSVRISRGGASIVYPKSAIKRIEYKKTREEIYQEKAAALKDDDLKGHLELAQWCVLNKLKAESLAEYRKVVAIEPDHEEARAALGHKLYNGKWMTEDEIKTAQGLVKYKGKWMTPEERDLEVALEQQKELDRKISIEVRKWLDKMSSSKEETRLEAKEKLAAIDDSYKAKPYLAALTSSSDRTRMFVVEELGRMLEKSAAKPLARRTVWDAVPDIRAAALKALLAIQHPDTSVYLLPYLEEESSVARMRVEDALSYFKDRRAVAPLLNLAASLLDTIQFIEQYENQLQQFVKRQLILKNGQKIQIPPNLKIVGEAFDPKEKAQLKSEKESCFAALRAITGQDFGEDVKKWAEWLKNQK